jgi:hypothetical protein
MISVRLPGERIDVAVMCNDVVVHLPNVGLRESAAGDEGYSVRLHRPLHCRHDWLFWSHVFDTDSSIVGPYLRREKSE